MPSLSNNNKGFVPLQGSEVTFVGLETGQTSATPTPVKVIDAESARGMIQLYNTSTNINIYLGPTDSVSTTDGFPLKPETYSPPLKFTGELYAMVQTTTSTLAWFVLR